MLTTFQRQTQFAQHCAAGTACCFAAESEGAPLIDPKDSASAPTTQAHANMPGSDSGDRQSRKFSVGQNVTLKQSAFQRAPADTFEIVRLLPIERGSPQYRIKSLRDGHERVVTESDIA